MKTKQSIKQWIETQKKDKELKRFKEVTGEFLKELRHRLEITQLQMAQYLGVSKKAIEKWEQGANPIMGTAARLIYLIHQDPKHLETIAPE